MGFFAPLFLAGTVAVGLPVWLHLLKKHKTTPLPFSSLMFFERRTQSSIKHRRLQYLLLFALRTAFVVLLALVFANPFIRRAFAPAPSGNHVALLAIDDSFSMRAGDRMARAKAEAVKLVNGGRAQVVSFGSQVHLMSDVTTDVPTLRAAIQAIEPTDTRGSFAELARAVRSIARSAKTPVDLHLFSDMQNSEMPSNFTDLKLGEGVRLIPHQIDKSAGNWAVESVRAPRRVYTSGKVRVQATIAGFGTEKATRHASLSLNGRVVETKPVDVPANGRATVEFVSLEAPYGMNRGEVRIDNADVLRDDDICYFSVERGEPRRVLYVHEAGNPRGLLYFRAALESPTESAFAIDPVTVEQSANLAPAKYALVVLSDTGPLPQHFDNELRAYVRNGGSVLVALGRLTAAAMRVPVFDEKIMEARYSGREGERFQTAAWLDPAHPSIGRSDRWDEVKFFQAVKVDSGKSRVAARLSDQTPLLMEKQIGGGRVIVFASTFDNIANDFPIHAAFVPFIEQTARYLARLDEGQASFLVGSYFDVRDSREKGTTVEVIDPKGGRALSLEEASKAQNIQLARAGFYEVRRPNKRDDLVAVNADRRESDLNTVPSDTFALWENTGSTQSGAGPGGLGEDQSKPVSIWWYIMLLVLALAVAESVLGNRHLTIDKEAA